MGLGVVTASAQPAATADYFPLIPGSEWRYSAGVAQVVRRLLPTTQSFHDTAAGGLRSTVNDQFTDTYWWSSSSGLNVHRIDQDESAIPQSIRFKTPLNYAPVTLNSGTAHTFSTQYGYTDPEMAEPLGYLGLVQGTTQISGPDSVTTGAGTFSCFKLTIQETWTEFGDIAYAGTTIFWLAPAVGILKASDDSGVSLELQSYSIPGVGLPSITTHPQGNIVNAGAAVTFAVQAAGTAPLAYQWRRNGENLPGSTSANLTLASVTLTDAGSYTVEVSNASGKAVSNPATLTVETPTQVQRPSITQWRRTPGGELELTFTAAQDRTWMFEGSDDLRTWTPVPDVTAKGPGTRSLGPIAAGTRRFFRMREGTAAHAALTLPVPGQLYPEGTRLGGDLFGFEFAIAPRWKGGLRVNSPWMIFGSDTEPGLILSILGFTGTREQLLLDPSLRDGFETAIDANTKLFFRATRPVAAAGNNRLSAGFTASGVDGTVYALNLEFLLHPDGGFLGFLGLTTEAGIGALQAQLLHFVDSARTPARLTNHDYLNALPGRSFKWESSGNEWYSGNWQGSASSTSWSESYAFFCGDGSFEINKESTSYVSSRNSGGWSSTYMSLSYGSTTKEYGQFTVVQDPQHGTLMLIATLAGYQVAPVRFQVDGSLLLGKNRLVPHEAFRCAAP